MRCIACDANLNDFDSTRKDLHGKYIDMCSKCYGEIRHDVLSIEREDLNKYEVVEDEDTIDMYNFDQATDD